MKQAECATGRALRGNRTAGPRGQAQTHLTTARAQAVSAAPGSHPHPGHVRVGAAELAPALRARQSHSSTSPFTATEDPDE